MSDETKAPEPEQPAQATREGLLRLRNQVPVEPYDVPGIGRAYMHGMTHVEAKQWQAQRQKDAAESGEQAKVYEDAKVIVRSLRDAAGKPLFRAGEETLIVELPELVVQGMIALCLKLNGMTREADEQILKNFATRIAAS